MVPAELLLGRRAGDWLPPTDAQGLPAEAVYLQRWINDGLGLPTRVRVGAAQIRGSVVERPAGLAAVLLSGFEPPCLLGLGSPCLDFRLFGATWRTETDCQESEAGGRWRAMGLTCWPGRRNALTRAQLPGSALFTCRLGGERYSPTEPAPEGGGFLPPSAVWGCAAALGPPLCPPSSTKSARGRQAGKRCPPP